MSPSTLSVYPDNAALLHCPCCAPTNQFPPPEWWKDLPFARHLRTNYIPTFEEMNSIRAIIGNHQRRSNRIDAAIRYRSDQIDSLVNRQATHTTYIEDLYALISPLRRLPIDLLPTIFEFCCCHMKDVEYLSDAFNSYVHPALVLTQVCRQWRDLALSLPSLWTVVKVLPPRMGLAGNRVRSSYSREALQYHQRKVDRVKRNYTRLMEKTETLFSRSGDRPLTIQIDATDFPPTAFWTPEVRPCIADLVELILGTSLRWKNLYLKVDILAETSPLLRLVQMTSDQLPLLQTLRFAASVRTGHFTQTTSAAILSSAGATSVGSLTKLNAYMRWGEVIHLPIQWNRLTHFALSGDNYWERPAFSIASAHSLLQQCVNLAHCTLQFTGDDETDDSTSDGSMITLPYLEALNIHGIECSNRKGLASRLHLPRLHTLSTYYTHTKPVTAEESGLVEWADLYGEQLTTVAFDYNSITQDALVRILGKLSKVSHLTMIGQAKHLWLSYNLHEENTQPPALINPIILQELTLRVDEESGRELMGECLCPNLERLECRLGEVEEDENEWLEMVATRRTKGVEGIRQIKEVLLTFDCPQTIDMQEGLYQRGLLTDDFSLQTFYQNDFPPELSPQLQRNTADWFCD